MRLSMSQRAAMVASSWRIGIYASLPDALAVGGAVLCSYGAWRIYEPAGFVVAGALMIAGAFMASRRLA